MKPSKSKTLKFVFEGTQGLKTIRDCVQPNYNNCVSQDKGHMWLMEMVVVNYTAYVRQVDCVQVITK